MNNRFMHKILFVCLGNICRSVTAEFVMKQLVEEAGVAHLFDIDSAATSTEELGNPIYPPMQECLYRHGIKGARHEARQVRRADYDYFDLIIVMDRSNLRNIRHIIPSDPEGKIGMLMSYAGKPNQDVADPWFTRNFDIAYDDILEGCEGLLKMLMKR